MSRSLATIEKALVVVVVALFALFILEKTNLINVSSPLLRAGSVVIASALIVIHWWRAKSRSTLVPRGALLPIVLFTVFFLLDELGTLRDYPFFVIFCLLGALTLMGYIMVYRNNTVRGTSGEESSSSETEKLSPQDSD